MENADRARALHDRPCSARRDHRRAEHALASLLAEMADARLHQALGYASIHEYAEAVLDLAPRATRDLVRVGHALGDLPVLARTLEAGDLDWTKARELVRVVDAATEAAWIAHAQRVPSRVLERDVSRSLAGEWPPAATDPERAPARRRVVFEMEAADAEALFAALATLRAQLGSDRAEVEDGALLAAMAHQMVHAAEPEEAPTGERYRVVLEHCPSCAATCAPEAETSDTVCAEAACDAEIVEMRPGRTRGHATRAIPPAMRRTVLHRARWRCEVPGCRSRLWLDVHHTVPWASVQRHDPGELLVLCCAHHRAVHDGNLAVEVASDGRVAATHADGRRRVAEQATHVGRQRTGRVAATDRRPAADLDTA